MKSKYFFYLFCILGFFFLAGSVLGDVQNYMNGVTAQNFSFTNDSRSVGYALNLFPNPKITEFSFKINSYQYWTQTDITNLTRTIDNGNTSSTTGGWTNPTYADDGSWTTYAEGQEDAYNTKYVNFTILNDSRYKYNFTFKYDISSYAINFMRVYCKNKTGNYWQSIFNVTTFDAITNSSFNITASCTNNTDTLEMQVYEYSTFLPKYARIYDMEVNEYKSNVFGEGLGIYVNTTSIRNFSLYNETTTINLSASEMSVVQNRFLSVGTQIFNISGLYNGSFGWSDLIVKYAPIFNFTIRDELTKNLYLGNVSVQIVANTTTTNYTTNGLFNIDSITDLGSIFRINYYLVSDIQTARSFFIKNLPNESHAINLYILNTSNQTQILFSVYDSFGKAVSGYHIGVYKKWLPDDTLYLVEMHKTDENGQALLKAQMFYYLYVFKIYDGNMNLIYTTGETEIKSTSITLRLRSDTEDEFATLKNIYGVGVGMPSYDSATQQFSMVWNDNSGLIDYIDMKTIRRTIDFGDIEICTNRSSDSTGTIRCTIDPSLPGIFVSSVWMQTKTNHSYYYLGSTEWGSKDAANHMGKAGVLAVVFLEIGMMGLCLWNPAVAIIMTLAILGLSIYMKLIIVSVSTFIVLVAIGGYLIVKGRV